AHSQALTGLSTARSLSDLNVAPASNEAAEKFMITAATTLQQQTGIGDNTYYVVVALRSDYQPTFTRGFSLSVDSAATLPPTLIKNVEKEQLATSGAGSGGNTPYFSPASLT